MAQVISIIRFGYILMFLLVNLVSEVRSTLGKINRKLITYFILHYIRFIINVFHWVEIIRENIIFDSFKPVIKQKHITYRMKFVTSIHASFLRNENAFERYFLFVRFIHQLKSFDAIIGYLHNNIYELNA